MKSLLSVSAGISVFLLSSFLVANHDDYRDYPNAPAIERTAALETTTEQNPRSDGAGKKVITDPFGAIVRGDPTKKELALVFTGDEFADGGPVIRETLRRQRVPASFFLTGRFYRNPAFGTLITGLKADGHYLGGHSDGHLLYCDWVKRDSLLVTEREFRRDLDKNYKRMKGFGIRRKDAPYFLPPYEWYNSAVTRWTKKAGLQLVNFTHGTRSTADYTYPEMGKSYRPSVEIYRSVMDYEQTSPNGLNGFILLVHIGTDPRRTDKFYDRLDQLITDLKGRGYTFRRIDTLLD